MWGTGTKIRFKRNVYHYVYHRLLVPWQNHLQLWDFREATMRTSFSSRISRVVLATSECGLVNIKQRQMCTNHTLAGHVTNLNYCSTRWDNLIYVHLWMHKWGTIMVHVAKSKSFFKENLGWKRSSSFSVSVYLSQFIYANKWHHWVVTLCGQQSKYGSLQDNFFFSQIPFKTLQACETLFL